MVGEGGESFNFLKCGVAFLPPTPRSEARCLVLRQAVGGGEQQASEGARERARECVPQRSSLPPLTFLPPLLPFLHFYYYFDLAST